MKIDYNRYHKPGLFWTPELLVLSLMELHPRYFPGVFPPRLHARDFPPGMLPGWGNAWKSLGRGSIRDRTTNNEPFHTGLGSGSAQIFLSRARAEPAV